MLYDLRTLHQELPGLAAVALPRLAELLPSLGFPVDGLEPRGEGALLDLDVTANRGDVQSHRGLARDLAAKLGLDLPPMPCRPLEEGEPLFPVRLEAETCPFYATALLELGERQATPEGAAELLAAMGAPAKQLATVDASNELLHRYGHPTHAFDADRLRGALVVRWARAGETLVTLDGVMRRLTVEDLVIADEERPVALAGLMGGEGSKVQASTRRVLLESAWFDPRVVRRMAHRHGLHTDASHRFGRGADPAMARIARDLLVERLQAWAGARLLGAWTVGTLPPARGTVSLEAGRLARIAGEAIPLGEAAGILTRLGCAVCVEGEVLHAQPPTWRFDLAIPEDLAEEVLRLRGFDRLGSALPPLEGPPLPLSDAYRQARALALRLAHMGFFQAVTFGFVSPEADAPFSGADNPQEGRRLGNPLGQEYSVMRASLLPSLKAAAELNRRQGAKALRLFEVAPAYRSSPEGPREEATLALLWGGLLGGEDYLSPARAVQAADLVGIGKDLGLAQPPAPVALGDGFYGWELPLSALARPGGRVIPPFALYSRFPDVERDLSLLVDLAQSYKGLSAAMEAALRACAGEAFRSLACVDVFRHKSLPSGRQAWLMRLRFQAMDRTLTGEEVEAWVAAALGAARSLGAELRS